MFTEILKQYKRALTVAICALLIVAPTVRQVGAQTISELEKKAQDLQSKIDSNNGVLAELGTKRDTLAGKVAELDAEIRQAGVEIELTEVKLEELRLKLIAAEEELERQKGLLKASLRALYERRGASTVELLIASDSFSDFINEQEYLDRLQSAVKDSADQVIALKTQIESEKKEQEVLLDRQEKQKQLLAGKRNEQQVLLTETEGEEAAYQAIIARQLAELDEAETKLAELIAAQLAANTITSYGPVNRGDIIGELGSTGFSTGPHIHFQVYNNGSTVNPVSSGTTLVNGYSWPLAGGVGYISQPYGCVAPPWYYSVKCNGGNNSFHGGLDIAASAFTPVIAAAAGEIVFRGCSGGLGYVVIVNHGNGWQTWYPHMVTPSGQVYGYC